MRHRRRYGKKSRRRATKRKKFYTINRGGTRL